MTLPYFDVWINGNDVEYVFSGAYQFVRVSSGCRSVLAIFCYSPLNSLRSLPKFGLNLIGALSTL